MPGEYWSAKYPGIIQRSNGEFRKPKIWINPRGVTCTANSYFKEINCFVCNKIFLWDKSNLKSSKNKVCSMKCRISLQTKPNGSKTYKGGYFKNHVMIKMDNHPYANNQGQVPEHRLVMEKHLGRILDPTEIVHHVNFIKNDNNINNLVLFKSASDHFKCHGSLNKCVAKLINKGYLKFNKEKNEYEVI